MNGFPMADVNEQGIALTAQWDITADVFSEQGLPMLTQITLGEKCEKDPNRPSLILRKAGKQRLWDIARECGSTVDAIVQANSLQDQPEADRILLIPVPYGNRRIGGEPMRRFCGRVAAGRLYARI